MVSPLRSGGLLAAVALVGGVVVAGCGESDGDCVATYRLHGRVYGPPKTTVIDKVALHPEQSGRAGTARLLDCDGSALTTRVTAYRVARVDESVAVVIKRYVHVAEGVDRLPRELIKPASR